jgi:hypothetical protein
VDIARITSGLLELGVSPAGMPLRSSYAAGEEAVAQARILLLVAELLEHVGEQVLGRLVLRLGLHELVQDLLREQVLALVVQLLAARQDLLPPPIIST